MRSKKTASLAAISILVLSMVGIFIFMSRSYLGFACPCDKMTMKCFSCSTSLVGGIPYSNFVHHGDRVMICGDCTFPVESCCWFDEDTTLEEVEEEVARQVEQGLFIVDETKTIGWEPPKGR